MRQWLQQPPRQSINRQQGNNRQWGTNRQQGKYGVTGKVNDTANAINSIINKGIELLSQQARHIPNDSNQNGHPSHAPSLPKFKISDNYYTDINSSLEKMDKIGNCVQNFGKLSDDYEKHLQFLEYQESAMNGISTKIKSIFTEKIDLSKKIETANVQLSKQEKENEDENENVKILETNLNQKQNEMIELIQDFVKKFQKISKETEQLDQELKSKISKQKTTKNNIYQTQNKIDNMKQKLEHCEKKLAKYRQLLADTKQNESEIYQKFQSKWNEFERNWLNWDENDIILWFKYKLKWFNCNVKKYTYDINCKGGAYIANSNIVNNSNNSNNNNNNNNNTYYYNNNNNNNNYRNNINNYNSSQRNDGSDGYDPYDSYAPYNHNYRMARNNINNYNNNERNDGSDPDDPYDPYVRYGMGNSHRRDGYRYDPYGGQMSVAQYRNNRNREYPNGHDNIDNYNDDYIIERYEAPAMQVPVPSDNDTIVKHLKDESEMKDILDEKEREILKIDFETIESNLKSQHIHGRFLIVFQNRRDVRDLGFKLIQHQCIIVDSIQTLVAKYPLPKDNPHSWQHEQLEGQILNTQLNDSQDMKIDEKYLCPLSKEIMSDPVIASNGKTYQRSAIVQYVQRHKQLPNQSARIKDVNQEIQNWFDDDELKRQINKLGLIDNIR